MNELKEILFEAYSKAEARYDAAYQNLTTSEDSDQKLYMELEKAHAACQALHSVIKEAGLRYEHAVWKLNQ